MDAGLKEAIRVAKEYRGVSQGTDSRKCEYVNEKGDSGAGKPGDRPGGIMSRAGALPVSTVLMLAVPAKLVPGGGDPQRRREGWTGESVFCEQPGCVGNPCF